MRASYYLVLIHLLRVLVQDTSYNKELNEFCSIPSNTDGKYHLLPTGELLIHNLDYTDRYATYRCRTMHRLTRQVVVSSSAKIRMNGERAFLPF